MAGYGHEKNIRSADVRGLLLGLPVIFEIVDTNEGILSVLPEIEAMVEHGLVTVQKVQMSQHGKKQVPSRPYRFSFFHGMGRVRG